MVSRPLHLFARSRMRLGHHRHLGRSVRRFANQRAAVAVA
jgi:hypothetical protein